ncbi:MAG: O-antigen ligase family protein, partial [Deltaproteobacteria bacterium]|nr:O-antigen ligase family protein [Deltaproteobacteria bacterium]
MVKDLEKAAFAIYLSVLAFGVLAFGGIHAYAYTIIILGVLTGSMLLLKEDIRKDPRLGVYRLRLPVSNLHLLFLLLLIYLVFQMIPLPDAAVRLLSPEAVVLGKKSMPASKMVISDNHVKEWLSLALYTFPVRLSLIRWVTYGLFFFGFSRTLTSRRRIETAIFVILLIGCFETLYGLIQAFSGSEHIWWWKKLIKTFGVITGTYRIPGPFAGLMGLCIIMTAAYAVSFSRRRKKIIHAPKKSLRQRLSSYLSGERQFNKRILVIFAGVVMGIGLVLSGSRGGIISAAGAMGVMGLLLVFRKGHRRKGLIILCLILITTLYLQHIGFDYTLQKFRSFEAGLIQRTKLALGTIDLYKDYRLTGTGVGNFKDAYPKYQPLKEKLKYFQHAHNDWAQFLAEAGIIGMSLLLLGACYYLYRTINRWKKRKDSFAVGLGAAPLAAMAGIAIFSYSDFTLHYPANVLMLAAILAVGNSALHLERHYGREKIYVKEHVIPLRFKGALALCLGLGLMTWSGIWAIRHFMAETYCNSVPNFSLNRDPSPPLDEIKRAVTWDGGNATYWWKMAQELIRIRNVEEIKRNLAGGGRRSEDGGRRSEVRGRRAEGRGQRTEDGGQKAEGGGQRTEDGGRKAEGGGPDKIQMEIIRALEKAIQLNPFMVDYHTWLGLE